MTEDRQFVSRRTVLKGSAIAAGVGVVGGGAFVYRSEPVVAVDDTELTFENIDATVEDREVQTVELDFGGVEFVFDGFDPEPNEIDSLEIEVTVNDDDEEETATVIDESNVDISDDVTEGSIEIEDIGEINDTFDLLAEEDISDDAFDIPDEESSSTTEVDVDIDVTVSNDDGEEASATAEESADITISLEGEVAVGGEITEGDISSGE